MCMAGVAPQHRPEGRQGGLRRQLKSSRRISQLLGSPNKKGHPTNEGEGPVPDSAHGHGALGRSCFPRQRHPAALGAGPTA